MFRSFVPIHLPLATLAISLSTPQFLHAADARAPTLEAPVIAASPRPRVYVAVYSHNEDPYHRETPRFEDDESEKTFWAFRDVTLEAALWLHARGIAYNLQTEWNFIKGIKKYEIENKGRERRLRREALTKTGGKNLIQYLSEDLGVEIDPHSHENADPGEAPTTRPTGEPEPLTPYNYADVAHLIATVTGITPTGVVGGQVVFETSYANWPRFKNPLPGSLNPDQSWTFNAITGESSANHEEDIRASGIWMPTEPGISMEYSRYFEIDRTSKLLAIGSVEASVPLVESLLARVTRGDISINRMLTAAVPFHASALVKAKYRVRDKLVQGPRPIPNAVARYMENLLGPLLPLEADGKIEFVTYERAIRIWKTRHGAKPFLCKQTREGSTDCTVVE